MACNHDGDAKKNMLAHWLELFDEEIKLTEFTHTRIISRIHPKTDDKQEDDCLASFICATLATYLYTSSAIKTGEAREKP